MNAPTLTTEAAELYANMVAAGTYSADAGWKSVDMDRLGRPEGWSVGDLATHKHALIVAGLYRPNRHAWNQSGRDVGYVRVAA